MPGTAPGDVVEQVVRGALEMSERFGDLGTMVERMERTFQDEPARLSPGDVFVIETPSGGGFGAPEGA